MKRMTVAALLAVGLHWAAFWFAGLRTRPVLPLARSQSVTINLVTVQAPAAPPPAPAPKKIPTPPKPKPKPKPKQIKKAAPKPLVRPRPAPAPPIAVEEPPAAPAADQHPTEIETAAPADPGPHAHKEHAAVQESVPLYDFNPPPVYPRVARRRNYQGTVLLDVRVSANGTVAEVKVAQSSGYSVLDSSALNSVRHWRFEPARRGARAVESWVQVPVRFELH